MVDRVVTRRDFLTAMGLASFSLTAPYLHVLSAKTQGNPQSPNVLVFLFDAFTARNLSLNGYPRETMPKFQKFMDGATVFHNHIASAPFTSPSTGTFLTGVHPWQHGAFHLGDSTYSTFFEQNLFTEFRDHGYQTISYTHNPHAEAIVAKMVKHDSGHENPGAHYLLDLPFYLRAFSGDFNASSQAFSRAAESTGLNNSLLVSFLLKGQKGRHNSKIKALSESFPLGLPNLGINDYVFVLEDVIDWIPQAMSQSSAPVLGYFHFWPPHFPYNTRKEFVDVFADDGFLPVEKPDHPLGQFIPADELMVLRNRYDEYLLYVDAEFDRLMGTLDESGLLENSYIIFTSDHGEMFERGIEGHGGIAMMQPVLHIPLVIKAPAQVERQDVYEFTSTVDMFPTLLLFANRGIPEWAHGNILPPFSNVITNDRPVISFNTWKSDGLRPFRVPNFSVIKNGYKLLFISGMSELHGEDYFELYDLANDPEELNDLYGQEPEIFNDLFGEIQSAIAAGTDVG